MTLVAGKLKNPKAKDIQELEGCFVLIYFKNVTIPQETKTDGVGIMGFIVRVTDSFVYLGADAEEEDTLISIEDVGIIRVPDDIEMLLHATGNSGMVPENSPDSEDLQ
jgi:hypothetical protein